MASAGEKYETQADLLKVIANLTSRVEKLERSSPKNQVVFFNSDGDILMRAGTDPEKDERVFTVGRSSGNGVALEVSTPSGPSENQSLKIYDHDGQVVHRDSETYGHGLSRPGVSANINHTTLALPAQTNTVYQTQAEAHFRKVNPSIEVVYNIFSSDGATPVSLRFIELNTGTQLTTQFGIANYEIFWNPAPAVLAKSTTPPLVLPAGLFPVGGEVHLAVQAYRVFPGVGTFVVQVLAVRGADES